MKRRVSIAAVFFSLTILPTVSSAQDQPWLQDRRYTEGIGIRKGDVELHPGAALEFGFDSNYFRASQAEGIVRALRLRVTPSISLSTLSRQRTEATPDAPPPDVEFRAGLAATYDEFFPVAGPEEKQDLMSDQRNIGGALDLKLTILPRRPWSAVLDADFGRSIAPSDQGFTETSFNRIRAGAGGELVWTPGGGLLDWRLGYHFAGTIFESSDFQDLTNLQHELLTRGRWRFLPRTALMYDARFGFINYPSGNAKTSSHPLRARLGVNGLVTPSFGVLALAGWGASFYTPVPQNDFDSVIGQLELKWFLTPNPSEDPAAATLTLSSVSVGFLRDFYDSYIGTYFEQDRGYLKFSYFFGGRFLLIADGGVGPVIYPDIPPTSEVQGHAGFTDIRIDGSLFGEYRLKDSIGINATLRYGGNLSDTSLTRVAPQQNERPNELKWHQFEAFLGVRWFM